MGFTAEAFLGENPMPRNQPLCVPGCLILAMQIRQDSCNGLFHITERIDLIMRTKDDFTDLRSTLDAMSMDVKYSDFARVFRHLLDTGHIGRVDDSRRRYHQTVYYIKDMGAADQVEDLLDAMEDEIQVAFADLAISGDLFFVATRPPRTSKPELAFFLSLRHDNSQ